MCQKEKTKFLTNEEVSLFILIIEQNTAEFVAKFSVSCREIHLSNFFTNPPKTQPFICAKQNTSVI